MSFFRQFYKGFKSWGITFSAIINTSLLFIAYVIGVGISSFFAKAFGKQFLELDTNKKQKSYWKDFNLESQPLEEYYRQF